MCTGVPHRKVPQVSVLIESLDRTHQDALAVLRDQSGTMKGVRRHALVVPLPVPMSMLVPACLSMYAFFVRARVACGANSTALTR